LVLAFSAQLEGRSSVLARISRKEMQGPRDKTSAENKSVSKNGMDPKDGALSKRSLIDSVIRIRGTGLPWDPKAQEVREDVEAFIAWRNALGSGSKSGRLRKNARLKSEKSGKSSRIGSSSLSAGKRSPAQSRVSKFESQCENHAPGELPSPLCELAARLKRDPILEQRAQALTAALEKSGKNREPAGDMADSDTDEDAKASQELSGGDDSPSETLARTGVPVLSAEPPAKKDLEKWLEGTEPRKFRGLTELKPLARAMRKFKSWPDLAGIVSASLRAKECPNGQLLAGLGMKAEEFFPDITAREDALRLYSRAAECGPDYVELAKAGKGGKTGQAATVFSDPTDPHLRSHYRAALLHLWNEDCEKADKNLQALSDGPSNPYVARALYWRTYCAKKSGNKLLQASLKGRVLKDHPLTVQGLVLGSSAGIDSELGRVTDLLMVEQPKVAFRSGNHPVLNDYVRVAEVLMERGERDTATEVLKRVERKLGEVEPEFALYISVLLSRLDDRIAQFRALSIAFKNDPATLSRSTLELFYPLHRFELIEQQKAKVDPLLAASLIRQESGFNERARSPAGAMGLMQLMPATARRMERVSRAELFDPRTNIRLGTRYFSSLLERFDGDAELALAAYNAGPERVDLWKKRYPVSNRALFVDLIPFRETRDYVSLIARNYFWYQALYGASGGGRGRVTRVDNARILEKAGQWFPLFKGL